MKSPRRPLAATFPASALALAAAFAALAIAGCNFADPFEGYRDSTTNFIAAFPFAAPPAASDWTNLDQIGAWDFSWRGTTGNNFDYMTFASVAEAPPAAVPTATVWRLELANLVDNGDFEAALGGAWLVSGSGTVTRVPATIHSSGSELRIETSPIAGDNWSGFDPSGLIVPVAAAAWSTTRSYFFRMIAESTPSEAANYEAIDDDAINAFSALRLQGPLDSGDQSLGVAWGPFGAANPRIVFTNVVSSLDLRIDELRGLDLDLRPKAKLRLRLRATDTSPVLRPGFVSFTVYARRPPGYRLPTDEEDGSLLYAASNLGVRIVQLKADGSIYRTPVDTSLPVTSGWTKLEFRGDSLDLFHDDPTQAVIDIEIFPFSASAYEPGVVLLAEPALNYYLDGY